MNKPHDILNLAQNLGGTFDDQLFAKTDLIGDIFTVREQPEIDGPGPLLGLLVALVDLENEPRRVAQKQRVVQKSEGRRQLFYRVIVAGVQDQHRAGVRDLGEKVFGVKMGVSRGKSRGFYNF